MERLNLWEKIQNYLTERSILRIRELKIYKEQQEFAGMIRDYVFQY